MKVKISFSALRLNLEKYRQDMTASLEKHTKKGGQLWLNAAIDEIPIPTWSGGSRATFIKVANALGTSVGFGPQKSYKNRRSLGLGNSQGRLVRDYSANFYGFLYSSSLRYLNYNNSNRATPGPEPQPFRTAIKNTPYNFTKKGEDAWRSYATSVRLVSPLTRSRTGRVRIR